MLKVSAFKIGTSASIHIIDEICVFTRNIIIARFLGADSLGQYITLILVLRLLTMSTDLAIDRFLISQKDKVIKTSLSTCHFLQICRGSLIAILLLVSGALELYGMSINLYAFAAAMALLNGFIHKGYLLEQRHLKFSNTFMVQAIPSLLGLASALCVSLLTKNLAYILLTVVIQSGLQLVLSHKFSNIRYTVSYRPKPFKKITSYGMPLLFSGLIMFWSMQGERIISSIFLPSGEFAIFSIYIQLALVPILLAGKVTLSIGLPLAVSVHENNTELRKLANLWLKYTVVLGLLFIVGFILFSQFVVTTLYGSEFNLDIMVISLIAASQAIRIIRFPHSIISQAIDQTSIPLKANTLRLSATIAAGIYSMHSFSFTMILIMAIIGELAAFFIQMRLLNQKFYQQNHVNPEQLI